MKAITVWQPWASLLAIGAKRFETRSWPTSYRGPIAIHAATRKPDMRGIPGSTVYQMIRVLQPITEKYAKTTMYLPIEVLPQGCVVGFGQLFDCYRIVKVCECNKPSEGYSVLVDTGGRLFEISITSEELLFGDWTTGRYAWGITNVKLLDDPMPAKGKQGLWEWSEGK